MYGYVYPSGVYYSPYISKAESEFIYSVRMLWEQHGLWTRSAIASLVFDLPDTEFVVARLLQNAEDMGESLEPYYGAQIGKRYGSLIHEHLVLAADLVKASKAGNTEGALEAERKWYKNADDIALFLSSINPFLNQKEVQEMLYHHLALVKAEAVSLLEKDYRKNVELYDKIELQSLFMADGISRAIVSQFPVYFR